MFKLRRKALLAGAIASVAVPAFAADMAEPVVEQAPVAPVYQPEPFGGWYIRGDLGYRSSSLDGIDYITYGAHIDDCNCAVADPGTKSFDKAELKNGFALGGGVGYQVTEHFRTDLTADYWFNSDFNGRTSDGTTYSVEESKMSALLLLANAYVDLGTYSGITPYIGAGIGGAHVDWDTVRDPRPGETERNPGSSEWRFAYALMAGASYCLTDHLVLDAGYRYTHIQGGRMFDWDPSSAGPGFDGGIDNHEVRGGLRYQFGNNNGCSAPQVAYAPLPEPVYTK